MKEHCVVKILLAVKETWLYENNCNFNLHRFTLVKKYFGGKSFGEERFGHFSKFWTIILVKIREVVV